MATEGEGPFLALFSINSTQGVYHLNVPPLLFMAKSCIFRTDVSPSIGTGHGMRCLVLAQACRLAGCTPSFLSAHPAEAFQDRLKKENVILHALKSAPYGKDDALETRRMADDAWIIVDGYTFDAAYLTALKKNGGRILAIDDFVHAVHYACDVILNQNVYAAREMYAGKTDATLLLGTRYALLHPEFAAAKKGRP